MEQSSEHSGLLEVKVRLERWRSNKKGRYIPDEIKEEVVKLLSEYSVSYLQRELSINGKSIISWKSEVNPAPVFITLPEPLKKQQETLSLKFSIGKLSMEGNLSVDNWQSALELLKGAHQ
jgi:hypothetical protein